MWEKGLGEVAITIISTHLCIFPYPVLATAKLSLLEQTTYLKIEGWAVPRFFGRRDLIVENLFDRQLVIKAVMIHCDHFEMQPQELPWSTWNAQNQESLLEGDGNEKEQMLWIILTLKCDIQALWVLYSESLSMTFCFTNNQQISCRNMWEYIGIYENMWEYMERSGIYISEARLNSSIASHCIVRSNLMATFAHPKSAGLPAIIFTNSSTQNDKLSTMNFWLQRVLCNSKLSLLAIFIPFPKRAWIAF